MTIQTFFELSVGKWFSQRTSHLLADRESAHQKSEIVVEILAADCPEILALAQQHSVAPSWGVKVTGNGLPDWNAPKNVPSAASSTILLPVPESDRLLCSLNGRSMNGTYAIADDESVTLILAGDGFSIEERIWFASDNLRMRTNVYKNAEGLNLASFCSEIRLGVTAAPTPAA
jgi:CpeS-like protein